MQRRGSSGRRHCIGWFRLCHCFFFFSSRRRHTRLQGDWSSDVCSSDLTPTYPDYHWVVRGDVDKIFGAGFTGRLQAAILTIDDPTLLAIFDRTKFIPAKNRDRKSTRLNSSHLVISYAVFCLKKKKIKYT